MKTKILIYNSSLDVTAAVATSTHHFHYNNELALRAVKCLFSSKKKHDTCVDLN